MPGPKVASLTLPAARYWRINILTCAAGIYGALQSLQFASSSGGGNRIAGGTASAQSSQTGHGAALAVDGTPTDYWGGTGALPVWWQYDFGAGNYRAVYEVKMTPSSGLQTYFPVSWNLQYSNDGSTWTTAGTFTSATWAAGVQQTFTTTATGDVTTPEAIFNTGIANVGISGNPTITLPLVPTPGNLIVAIYTSATTNAPSEPYWTRFATGGNAIWLMYRYVQPGDTATLSPMETYSAPYSRAVAWEISGCPATWTNALDQSQFTTTTGSWTSETTATLTTASPDELGLAQASNFYPYGTAAPTISAPWSTDITLSGQPFNGSSSAHQSFVAAGSSVSVTGTFTATNTVDDIVVILLKATTGGQHFMGQII